MAFAAMYPLGINANIMSLGGIAIAIGVMVDASVVLVENAHKHLERDKGRKSHTRIIIDASREVSPALFYSLLIITISFLPVFTLGGQSGRLFKPLAYTKTFAMAASSILAVTVIPVLMTFFVKERTIRPDIGRRRRLAIWIGLPVLPPLIVLACHWGGVGLPDWSLTAALVLSLFILVCLVPQTFLPEARNPVSRFFIVIYLPLIRVVLRRKKATIAIAVLCVATTWYPMSRLGSEFMPPLNEGDLLYMQFRLARDFQTATLLDLARDKAGQDPPPMAQKGDRPVLFRLAGLYKNALVRHMAAGTAHYHG